MWRRLLIGLGLFFVLTPIVAWVAIDQIGRAEWRHVQKDMQAKGVATTFAEFDFPKAADFPAEEKFFAIPLFLTPDPGDEKEDDGEKPKSLDDAIALALAKGKTTPRKVDHGAWNPIIIFSTREIYRYEFPKSEYFRNNGGNLGIAVDLEAWAQYLDVAAADIGIQLDPDDLPTDPLARVSAYLNTASSTWAQIDRAAQRPKASLIPPVGERLTSENMPTADAFDTVVGLNDLQRLTSILSIRTIVAIRSNDIETLRSCLRVYGHLIETCEQERTMIGDVFGTTVFATMKPALYELSWSTTWTTSDDNLLFCQDFLERFDFRQQFIDTMPVELAYGLEVARWFRDHRDQSWDLGFGGEALESSRKLARLLPKGWFDNSMAFHCELADRHQLEWQRRSLRGEYVPFTDLQTTTRKIESEIADLSNIERIQYVMPAESLTSYGRILNRIQEAEAWRRMAIIVCALNRWKLQHGNYPQKLDDLVPEHLDGTTLLDPFDGHQLRYLPPKSNPDSPDGEDFLLYSVAIDSVDNSGELVIDPDRLERTRIHTDKYRGDWPWPTRPLVIDPTATSEAPRD